MFLAGYVTSSSGGKMLVFLVLLSRLHWSWPRTLHESGGLTAGPNLQATPTVSSLEHVENETAIIMTTAVTDINLTFSVPRSVTLKIEAEPTGSSATHVETGLSTSSPATMSTLSPCLSGHGVASSGSVFLTLSSLAETSGSGAITERRLKLNWQGFTGDPGQDTVALFDRDPTVPGPSVPLDQAKVVEHPDGSFTTYVQFPRLTFSPSNLTSECLGYWAAYLRGGVQVLAVSCFRARPFWMQEMQEEIGELALVDLMIPGTHDSGSYKPYMGKKSENVLIRYVYAQEESVFNQLAYGIRCLDLRVGFYNKTKEKFWINHSYFKTSNTLAVVVEDIKRFLETTSEIIILDFHRFPVGFDGNPTAHKMLIEYLVNELGSYLIPYEYDYGVKIKTLIGTNKKLLAAYNSKQRKGHPLLWPGIRQYWGDKQNADQLITYFESVFQGDIPKVMWSSMAELTPTSSDILLQPKRGLRILAEEVNWKLSVWFRDFWAELTNIVATDYFLGNNLIEVSIITNKKKYCAVRENATAG